MDLDKNQKKVVEAQDKNILVIAAPGSGKTLVLVKRCEYLIKNGVNPENILLLTFTKSAAVVMKDRLSGNIKNLPFIGTFHSFLYRMQKEEKKINLIREEEKDKLIKDILKEYQEQIKEGKIRNIKNEISKFKRNENYIFEDKLFKYIYESYSSYLKRNSLLDFDDLELEGCKIIKNNKHLLLTLKNKYKHILVDEFQDVDELEVKFLKLIGEDSSLYFVGDEDQCIFSFRGSRPYYTYNFKEEFKGGCVYYLNNNYRSKETIVTYSENLIRNNKKRSSKDINRVKKEKGRVLIWEAKDNFQEAELVLKIIKESIGNIGILYRNKKDAGAAALHLLNNNVFFNYYEDPLAEIKSHINDYISLSKDKFLRKSFENIVNKPNRYVSRLNLIKLSRYYLKEDIFKTLYLFPSITKIEYKNLKKLEWYLNKLNKIKVEDKLSFIFKKLGYSNYLNEVLKSDNYDNLINNLYKNEDSHIRLSTIHKAKGSEYENIIILNASKNNMPYYRNEDIEEERRICYVALTRGISNVYFITRDASPSPFLDEVKS